MLKNKKINVAIIGLGVGKKHLEVIKKIHNCTIDTVCDFDVKKLKEKHILALKATKTNNYREILDNKNIELVVIASNDNYHANQVVEFVNSGKHVFIEKPICLTDLEFVKIKKCLKKNPQIKISSNFVLRTKKTLIHLKKIIEQKKMGKTYYFEGDYNFGRLEKIIKSWRGNIPFYSVMHGGGLHLIDLLLWMNNTKVLKVSAEGNNLSTKNTQFKYNDLITSILKFKDGTIAKVTANFGSVMPHHHILNVYGTKGSFIHNLREDLFYNSRELNKRPKKIHFKDNYKNKGDILKSFINSVKYKKKCIVSKSDVLDSMAVSLAIEKSITKKKWIKVKYN